ncbi:Transcriptional activator DEMETER-like protein [Quillaja saponaria]|uniref:Transcriptional activator DEMETER-like protein n=1 Tax=Quillaja saponaria TaxID=32244 RepID=A0AAD7PYG4_QUISA|nr:Transcriptional activator DEMETER-like protein [Quillaja saponaria]
MDVGGESKEKLQPQVSWIPTTPIRPILPKSVPIYIPEQGNLLNQTTCLGSSGSSSSTQNCCTNGIAACTAGSSPCAEINTTGASSTQANITNPPLDMARWKNVSFADLLALANAASAASPVANPFISAPLGSTSSTVMSLTNHNSSPELNPHNSQCVPQEPMGVISAAYSNKSSSQIAPPTPDKATGAVSGQVQRINIDSDKDQESGVNHVSATRLDDKKPPHNQEPSLPATDSSITAVSMEFKENHNPDKGDSHDIDPNRTPQQKPRRKRHRPKVITEGKPKRTPKPMTPKPVGSSEKPTGKRKYVRKKGTNKPFITSPTEGIGTPPTEVIEESTEPITTRPKRKSCRRSLNFAIGGQPRDESSTCKACVDLNSELRAQDLSSTMFQSKPTVHLGKRNEVAAENSQVGLAHDLNHLLNQKLKDDMSLTETQVLGMPAMKKNLPMTNPSPNSQKENNTKGKVQATAQNRLENTVGIMSEDGTQSSCPNDFYSGNNAVRSKRKHSAVIKHADTSSTNSSGANYNTLLEYQTMCWVIHKKRRSEKGQNSNTSTTPSVTARKNVRLETYPQKDAEAHPYASKASYWVSGSKLNAIKVPVTIEETEQAPQDIPQTFESIMALGQMERLRKKRSRVSTRVCDLASLSRIAKCNMQQKHSFAQPENADRQRVENSEGPHTCIDALVAEMRTTLATKKRTRKRNALVNSVYPNTNHKLQHSLVLYNHHQTLGKSPAIHAGAAFDVWKQMLAMDTLIEQFNNLDINRETRNFAFQEHNALVPYNMRNQRQNALVIYGRDGAIIPFEGSFDPIRKLRPRPKVDLDEETNRVWKLLLQNINSESIDGTDEEKAKWWKEERRVFRGRADSFIARMHLVQGDRRFTPWKGSVVDSVVGVFLTQNVSDHLSSSAFMSLAARFPLKSSSEYKAYYVDGERSAANEPEVHILEPEETISWGEKILNQSVYNRNSQNSMTIHDIHHNGEKEVVSSNDSSRVSCQVIGLTDESNCKLLKLPENNQGKHHCSMMNKPNTNNTGVGEACHLGLERLTNDIVSSQNSGISSQNSGDSFIDQTVEKIGSSSDSNSDAEDLSSTVKNSIYDNSTSFVKLLEMAGSTMLHEVNSHRNRLCDENSKASKGMKYDNLAENMEIVDPTKASLVTSFIPSNNYALTQTPDSEVLEAHSFDTFKIEAPSSDFPKNKDDNDLDKQSEVTAESASQARIIQPQSMLSGEPKAVEFLPQEQNNNMQNLLKSSVQTQDCMKKTQDSVSGQDCQALKNESNDMNAATVKGKHRLGKEKRDLFDWDSLRKQTQANGRKRERTERTVDSLDWEAVRCAEVGEIANTIKERGMNNVLAERIQDFLNRLVKEHGSIDLEWLRDVPPDQAKEYLLSIRGLGLKSVECVRLLTLHHLAFPVDTNVGRIAVRLGWVPLQPLPESLQLHLLELYPVLESIQKYLWPRLCKLDQRTLYELHYQMITFGKVFCTKSKPNCNSCPMRGECRHFASAFASARLALPGPEQKSIVTTTEHQPTDENPNVIIDQLPMLPQPSKQAKENQPAEASRQPQEKSGTSTCQPIIEEPATPEPECTQISEIDMEDCFYEDPNEIPTIKLDIEEFTLNLQNYMQNMELQEGEMSKALVALTPEAASIPMPKLKNVSQLRTEHNVYELPDVHPLLEGLDMREPDDPGKYLLAIWTPGETANSFQTPESKCSSQEFGLLCDQKECFSCNCIREANSQTVRGTLLIPCRTAMRGSFPLNGTYFQVNEVFADHYSSLNPIHVPRSLIWNLRRRTVYFGTSIPTIFKGLSTKGIQECFWKGYVCVRGFDRESRAPRPLMARLHFPASKLTRTKGKTDTK